MEKMDAPCSSNASSGLHATVVSAGGASRGVITSRSRDKHTIGALASRMNARSAGTLLNPLIVMTVATSLVSDKLVNGSAAKLSPIAVAISGELS